MSAPGVQAVARQTRALAAQVHQVALAMPDRDCPESRRLQWMALWLEEEAELAERARTAPDAARAVERAADHALELKVRVRLACAFGEVAVHRSLAIGVACEALNDLARECAARLLEAPRPAGG